MKIKLKVKKDIDDELSPKSDDGYISNTRTTLGSGLGIDGGILKSKDMNGYIPNTRATEESMLVLTEES